MDDRAFLDTLFSLHARLEALECGESLGYSWPARVGGANLKQKFLAKNWDELVAEFDDTRALPHDGKTSGPCRVTLVDPISETQWYEYVSQHFQSFLDREWAMALRKRTRREESVTEHRRIPSFTESDPDGTWSNSRRSVEV